MKFANLAALALVFVILYNLFFFKINLGIGMGVLYLLLHIFFFLSRNKDSKNLDFAIAGSFVAVTFAFLHGVVGNGFVQFIDFLVANITSSIAFFFYKYEPRFSLNLPNFLMLPLSSFLQTAGNFFDFFGEKEKIDDTSKNELTPAIVRGGVIAIVLVGVLTLLLTKGDLVFGKIVNNFLSNIWERLIISSVIFISLLYIGFTKIKSHISWMDRDFEIGLGKMHELAIILGSIIGLFTLFIGIQFRYLFLPVGETELREIGVNSATYSEYVRAGFSELLIAGAIVGGVLLYVLRYVNKLQSGQKTIIQLLATVLTLENYLILVSATKRLFLYVDAHGLTRAREFGFVFLIWLTAILVIILIGFLYKLSRELKTEIVIGITLVALLSINIVNLDELIATKYPPTVNKEIDYSYLTSLSTDAHKSWVPAVNEAESLYGQLINKDVINTEDYRKFTYAQISIENLNNLHTKYLQDKYGSGNFKWPALNLSQYFAYQYIRDEKQTFDKMPKLFEQAKQIEQKVTAETRNATQYDRSSDTPLNY